MTSASGAHSGGDSILAISLALGASLVYGVSDFIGGLKSRSLPLLSVLLVSQATALVLLATLVLAHGAGPPDGRLVAFAALAGLSEAVGVAALYRGLAVGTMSIVTPVAAVAPVIPIVAAIAVGQAPAPVQAIGIAFALAGIVLISHASAERPGSQKVGRSVLFGLLTALGFGFFLVGIDAASEESVPWALLVARVRSMGAFALAFVVRRPRLELRREEIPVLALIGALIVSADAMYALASTQGLLSVVAVLSSLYPIVTIAIARVHLHERLQTQQKLGAAAALAGAAAISAGCRT